MTKMSQPPLLTDLPGEWPAWFTPSKLARIHANRVQRGLHPLGMDLGPPESRCGTCASLTRACFSRAYLKCSRMKQTRGPVTDVRAKWRGCSLWMPAAGEERT